MVTDFPIQGILDHLALRIVDLLPITGPGSRSSHRAAILRYLGASNASALPFEQLQTELGEGPWVAAYQTGDAAAAPDLREECGCSPRPSDPTVRNGLQTCVSLGACGGNRHPRGTPSRRRQGGLTRDDVHSSPSVDRRVVTPRQATIG
jgi:hypothetical protein